MSRPVLGDFLQLARTRLADAEHTMPTEGTGVDEAASELRRLTTVLQSYLSLAVPPPTTSAPRPPWNEPAAGIRAALNLATESLARWSSPDPGEKQLEPGSRAWLLAGAADALAAGHDLIQTHLEITPDGLAGRSWWAPVTGSPQVTAAIVQEVTSLTRQAARQAGQLSARSRGDTAAALGTASTWLQQGADAGHAGRAATSGEADPLLLHAIPPGTLPEPAAIRPGEPEPALCAGIETSAERLRNLTIRQAATGTVSGDAWHYTATAARIASHLASTITNNIPDDTGRMTAAAVSAVHASAAWQQVAAVWTQFRTDTFPAVTPAMTDVGDLITRLGRLTFDDPTWTPARGTRLPLRGPGQARAVLGAVHQAADALSRMADADLAAVADACASGRIYTHAPGTPAGRYAKADGQDTMSLYDAYLAAAQTAGNLTSRMDQIAVSRTTPSITLTRARAAAPARAGVAWPSNLTSIPAEESDDTATPVPTRGEDVPVVLPPAARLERRVQHMGIQDPGLLLEAHAIDRAAEALLRQATDDPAATSPPGPRSHRWRTDHQRGTGRGD